MSLKIVDNGGNVEISSEVIAKIAGLTALDCYGVVGTASRKAIKDGIAEILGKDIFDKGIIVTISEEQHLQIDLHIIVLYGTKISEIAKNVQAKVKFALEEALDLVVDNVNVFVQGIKLDEA
jgi:uncharacterized alkaline shock family protein YloU